MRRAQNMNPCDQAEPMPLIQIKQLRVLLYLCTLLLLAGLVSPIMTLSKFMLLNHSFSILSGAAELLLDGQILLFIVIAGFSIVLPLIKLLLLYRLLSQQCISKRKLQHSLRLMHDYGRWAMLDVMVVAILVVSVKLGALASVKIHYGLYLFAAATLMIMLLTHRVTVLYEKLDSNN